MSDSNPRPLPPRALPPLQNDNQNRPASARPRRKPRQANNDTSLNRSPREGGRNNNTNVRVRARGNNAESPRSQDVSYDNEDDGTGRSVDRSGVDTRQEGERRPRKKRRRRPQPQSQGEPAAELSSGRVISSLLSEEDVVNVDKIDEAVVLSNLPGVAAGGGSAISDKVYVQTTNGFASHNQEWLNERNKMAASDARFAYGEDVVRSSQVAEQNERGFMFITLLLHGMLAGFSIWQVVVSFTLSASGEISFLTQYQSLAGATQTVYYIVLAICFVSAMDRYNFAGPDKHIFISLAKFDLAAWAVALYLLAFLFSIGMAGLDAWIASGVGLPVVATTPVTVTTDTPPLPPSLTGEELDVPTTVNTWFILNVFRAVLSALGWLVIAVDPKRNDMKWDE